MKAKYINPTIRVREVIVENLMQPGLSETPADPGGEVLGKESNFNDDSWTKGNNIWED